jgi:sterol 24-C-methyltransferase
MAPVALQREDHERDAAFKQALHGKSAAQKNAFMAMISKDSKSQEATADAYFAHWDNKDARVETEEDREVREDPFIHSIPTTT